MAGEFQLKDGDGRLLLAPGGEFAVHADCCCDCEDCIIIDQPPCSLVVSGICADQATCDDAGDVALPFASQHTAFSCCYWTWQKIYNTICRHTLQLRMDIATGQVKAHASLWACFPKWYYGGAYSTWCTFSERWLDITGDVLCDHGTMTGTFTLPGLDPFPGIQADCIGCTLTVELDP